MGYLRFLVSKRERFECLFLIYNEIIYMLIVEN